MTNIGDLIPLPRAIGQTLRRRVIVLFGPRDAGKTVFIAVTVCGASETDFGYEAEIVEPNRDRTQEVLSSQYQSLSHGDWPRATPFDAATIEHNTYHIEITFGDWPGEGESEGEGEEHSERRYAVRMADIGGELTRNSGQSDPGHARLKAEILEDYGNADGILLFVRSDLAEADQPWQYKQEVDVLLHLLRQKKRTDIPVAVVLSKWDVGGRSLGPKPTEQDEWDADHFFQTNYPMLSRHLDRVCPHVQVFPVSATGPVEDGRPPSPLRPYNVAGPLVWLLDASDRVRFTRTKSRAARWAISLAALGLFVMTSGLGITAARHHRQLRAAEQLMDRPFEGTPRGNVLEQVEQTLGKQDYRLGRYDPWLTHARARYLTFKQEYRVDLGDEITRLVGRLDALKREDVDRLIALAVDYDAHYRDSDFSPLPQTIDQARRRRRELEMTGEYEAITARIRDPSAYSDLPGVGELILKCDSFLGAYSDAPKALLEEIRRIAAAATDERAWLTILAAIPARARVPADLAREIRDGYLARDTFTRHRPEAETLERLLTVAASKTEPLARCEVYHQYLVDTPRPSVSQVDTLWRASFEDADDAAHTEAISSARAAAGNLAAAEAAYGRYLTLKVCGFSFLRHRDEVERAWDALIYENVRTRVERGFDVLVFRNARAACDDYLRSECPRKAMLSAVKQWADWYDDLDQGAELRVALQSLEVDPASLLAPYFLGASTAQAVVEVRINGEAKATGSFAFTKGVSTTVNREIGAFRASFSTSTLGIVLTTANFASRSATLDFSGEPGVIRHLNELLYFDNGRARARLTCARIASPAMPQYTP
jgi:hypothetical protein